MATKNLQREFARLRKALKQLHDQYLLGDLHVWERLYPHYRMAYLMFNHAVRQYEAGFVEKATLALKDAEEKIAAAWEAKKHVRPVGSLAGRQGPGNCTVDWVYVGYWDPVADPYREQEITEQQAKRLIDEIHKIGKQFEGQAPMPSFQQVLTRACEAGEASVLFRGALTDPNGVQKLYHGIHATRRG